MLLFSAKAVTELIIVSGRMVGLILVMQCVPVCAGSGGSWQCEGSPCLLRPATIPSVCLSSWEGYFLVFSDLSFLGCFWTSLDHNKVELLRWLGVIYLCRCLKPCHGLWCLPRDGLLCPEWSVSDWQANTGLRKITWMLKALWFKNLSLHFWWDYHNFFFFPLILTGWGVTFNPRFSDFRLFFPPRDLWQS